MRLPAVVPIALLLGLGLAARDAYADRPPARGTGVNRRSGRLLASVGLQDIFQPADRQRLRSGFATRVLIRVHLYREGLNQPVAAAVQSAEIVYDLWDEKFQVRLAGSGGSRTEGRVATEEEAILLATALRHFPVAELTALQRGARHFLAFRADLNPISEELVADVRRWLVNPPGGQRRLGGDSFFGSFVSIFVNPRIEDSERQLRFFSQAFVP